MRAMRVQLILAIIVVVIVGLAVVQWTRAVGRPVSQALISPRSTWPGTLSMPWPAGVQAVADVPGVGLLGRHGPTSAEPIGSVAKMMTALIVIAHHPLAPGSAGPKVTITPADVAAYHRDAAAFQSVMPVQAGERLSERTLLKGILVASGNNVATLLAKWAVGSTSAFAAEMNRRARAMGLHSTHYHGPSGLSSATVSTAWDQVRVAEALMRSPVLAQMVATPQMTVPHGGIVYNFNRVLGRGGVIGVKTGSTVSGGASFIWAARQPIAGKSRIVYGGVVGQPPTVHHQLRQALDDGLALIKATAHAIVARRVLRAGQTVGYWTMPWGSRVSLTVTKNVRLLGWPGMTAQRYLHLTPPAHLSNGVPAGTRVGTVVVSAGSQTRSVTVTTSARVSPPSPLWRLTRL